MEIKYQNLTQMVGSIKKTTKVWVVASLLLQLIFILGVVVVTRENRAEQKLTIKEMSSVEVCLVAFKYFSKGVAEPMLHDEKLLKYLTKNKGKMEGAEISSITMKRDNHCEVIIREKMDQRHFELKLTHIYESPYFYKLTEINEINPEVKL